MDILKQFSIQTSVLEVCKFAKDSITKTDLNSEKIGGDDTLASALYFTT